MSARAAPADLARGARRRVRDRRGRRGAARRRGAAGTRRSGAGPDRDRRSAGDAADAPAAAALPAGLAECRALPGAAAPTPTPERRPRTPRPQPAAAAPPRARARRHAGVPPRRRPAPTATPAPAPAPPPVPARARRPRPRSTTRAPARASTTPGPRRDGRGGTRSARAREAGRRRRPPAVDRGRGAGRRARRRRMPGIRRPPPPAPPPGRRRDAPRRRRERARPRRLVGRRRRASPSPGVRDAAGMWGAIGGRRASPCCRPRTPRCSRRRCSAAPAVRREPRPAPGDVGGWRYDFTSPGDAGRMSLVVLPATTRRRHARLPRAGRRGTGGGCVDAVLGVELRRGAFIAPGPEAAVRIALPAVLARLDRDRRAGRRELAAAETTAARVRATRVRRARLRRRGRAAARSPAGGRAAALVAVLRRLDGGLPRGSRSPTSSATGAWRLRAGAAIGRREARLERMIAAFSRSGRS